MEYVQQETAEKTQFAGMAVLLEGLIKQPATTITLQGPVFLL